MRLKAQRSKLKAILILSIFYFLLSTLCGCEAFRKKFVRKAKGEKEVRVVTQTDEYTSGYSIIESYQRHFSFWLAAHDELIVALRRQQGSRKRRLEMANRSADELLQMRQFLIKKQQLRLDQYILKQKAIAQKLAQRRISRAQWLRIKGSLNRQKSGIKKEFSLKTIRDFLPQP